MMACPPGVVISHESVSIAGDKGVKNSNNRSEYCDDANYGNLDNEAFMAD